MPNICISEVIITVNDAPTASGYRFTVLCFLIVQSSAPVRKRYDLEMQFSVTVVSGSAVKRAGTGYEGIY